MCLGIPGRVTLWIDRDPLTALAEIEFGGIRRNCQMACVTEADVGDYVLVHAGIGLAVIDAMAAEELLRTLNSLGNSIGEIGESA
ncbi:MAG: HypC/HybG/HupF family hydrogenase formation chaperone [Planctomycetales bacterium]